MNEIPAHRKVQRTIAAQRAVEGDGFVVRRPFPTAQVSEIDPFLLLDHLGPIDYAPGEAKGTPDHPHRGFETVSFVFEGDVHHRDSRGHEGLIKAGGVQWMTAGSGIIHKEQPSEAFQRVGGRSHGIQLWVNLPAAQKMAQPRYQDLQASDIPTVTVGASEVRVVAGTFGDVTGPVQTHLPILALICRLNGDSVSVEAPSANTTLAYVISGVLQTADGDVPEANLVQYGPGSEPVVLNGHGEVLLLSGMATGDPIVRYGPFVMNTKDEIVQAFRDYERGVFDAVSAAEST